VTLPVDLQPPGPDLDQDGAVDDDQAAAMAAAALVAVKGQRDATHDQAAAGLLAALAPLAAGYDPTVLRGLDPDDPRQLRRALVSADLARQVSTLDVAAGWAQAARDAHTAAVMAGTAAAAHALTAGAVPVAPTASDLPDPFNPTEWVAAQQGGMAGDLVDVGVELADAELVDLIGSSPGALYYLDLQVAQTYVDASAALYVGLGMTWLDWNTMADACPVCQGLESGNPYSAWDLPLVPHGLCRCWVVPVG
jgi:hypothetical protein